jgi:hypothetical protein
MNVLDGLANWLMTTRLSSFVNSSPWVWAACETVHFIGLTVLIGTAGLLDLRLLGFFRRLPVAPLRGLFPWMLGAFLLNVITGIMFFTGSPFQYIHNIAFGLKLVFVGIAGVNAFVFAVLASRDAALVGPGMDVSATAKVCGAVSLVSWFAVLYFGRMLPYLGQGY